MKMKKWIAALACLFVVSVHAQENTTLHIGDRAPALKYSKWIKGTPVPSFKGDQLYVLEFWSTWCHPCIEAMPHLTQLQKKHKGKISIIGVGIWETAKAGEPYESTLPRVERFVARNSANMDFSVIADNNDKFMATNWHKAAGLNGIPATFIIQNEKIVWIGGPTELDSTLELIMTGRYNMQEYIQSRKKAIEDFHITRAKNEVLMRPVNEALKAKKYEEALTLIDKLIAEPITLSKDRLYNIKFETLLNCGSDKEAIAWGESWLQLKESDMTPFSILWAVIRNEGLAKTTYLWAARNFNIPASKMHAGLRHLHAHCYAKAVILGMQLKLRNWQ